MHVKNSNIKYLFIVPGQKSADETHVDFVPTMFPHRSSVGSQVSVLSRCDRRKNE